MQHTSAQELMCESEVPIKRIWVNCIHLGWATADHQVASSLVLQWQDSFERELLLFWNLDDSDHAINVK